MSKALIIYAAKSLSVRRVIVHDDESAIATHGNWTVPGEAAVTTDTAGLDMADVAGTLARVLSVPREKITEPRCVVVDESGEVVHVLMADPDIDKAHHPAHRLMLHSHADIGWKLHPVTGLLHKPE